MKFESIVTGDIIKAKKLNIESGKIKKNDTEHKKHSFNSDTVYIPYVKIDELLCV